MSLSCLILRLGGAISRWTGRIDTNDSLDPGLVRRDASPDIWWTVNGAVSLGRKADQQEVTAFHDLPEWRSGDTSVL
jgi:hypothetical protein